MEVSKSSNDLSVEGSSSINDSSSTVVSPEKCKAEVKSNDEYVTIESNVYRVNSWSYKWKMKQIHGKVQNPPVNKMKQNLEKKSSHITRCFISHSGKPLNINSCIPSSSSSSNEKGTSALIDIGDRQNEDEIVEDSSIANILEEVSTLRENPPFIDERNRDTYCFHVSQIDEINPPSRHDPRSPIDSRSSLGRMPIHSNLNENPFLCLGCGKTRKTCHEVQYGPYIYKRSILYFIEHGCKSTAEDMCKYFQNIYTEILRYQIHHATRTYDTVQSFDIPECMSKNSLAYLMNTIDSVRGTSIQNSSKLTLSDIETKFPPHHKFENSTI